MPATIKYLPVEKLGEPALQTRAEIYAETVAEYAEAMQAGEKLPPLDVFHDGMAYHLADGFHRVAAARRLKVARIACEIHKGTRIDALRHALGANKTHGLRRTNADKAKAVRMAYDHRQELGLPDVPAANLVADLVGVDNHFVAAQLGTVPSWRDAPARTGADGRTRSLPPTRRARGAPSEEVRGGAPSEDVPGAEGGGGGSAEGRGARGMPSEDVQGDGGKAEVGGQKAESRDQVGAAPARRGPPPARRPAAADMGPVDRFGRHIPVELQPLWARRQEVQDLLTAVSRVRAAVKAAQASEDPLFREMNYSSASVHADRLYTEIAATLPYCLCPMCQGIGCRVCKERGLLGQYRFDHVVPEAIRAGLREPAKGEG